MKKILIIIPLFIALFFTFSCSSSKRTPKQQIRDDFTYLTTDDHVFEYITYTELHDKLEDEVKAYVYFANNTDTYSNQWIPLINTYTRTDLIYILDYKALSEDELNYFVDTYSLYTDVFPQLVCFNYDGKNMFSTYVYVSESKTNENFRMGVVQLFSETIR